MKKKSRPKRNTPASTSSSKRLREQQRLRAQAEAKIKEFDLAMNGDVDALIRFGKKWLGQKD